MYQAMYLQRYRVSYNKIGKSVLVMGAQERILKKNKQPKKKTGYQKTRKIRADL